jgi:hypothetical protein
MPIGLLISIAGSWFSSGLFPLLKKVPWQVWAAIAGVLAIMYYGHVREKRGFAKCHDAVVTATEVETKRRAEAAEASAAEAQSRASESAQRAKDLEGELNVTQKEVAKLKNAKVECLPGAITDRFQRSRVRPNR